MSLFATNLLLALFWAAVSNDFSLFTLFMGYIVGFIVLYIFLPKYPRSRYFKRSKKLVSFMLFYLKEVFLGGLKVSYDVLTPSYKMNPGIISVPLDAKTNVEITLLANLISLTPGTLSLDVSDDKSELYVHVMFIHENNVKAEVEKIKRDFESRVLELLK